MFTPGDLEKWTGGAWHRSPSAPIRGFTIDSRRVRPGDCFVALKTERRNGHDYLGDALERGAVAALVEEAVDHELAQLQVDSSEKGLQDCAAGYREQLKIPIIGISGSCGKTSTKDLLTLLLGPEITLSTEANLNNTLGVPLTILRIDESIHQYAVVEAGINRRGEMDTIAKILRPSHGIITMVGNAHSEGLGRIDQIAVEKCKLLEAVTKEGMVAFPTDCKTYEVFDQLRKAHVYAVERVELNDNLGSAYAFRVSDDGLLPEARDNFCARDTETKIEIREIEIETDRQRMQECGREKRAIIVDLPATPVFYASLPRMSGGMAMNTALSVLFALRLGVSPADVSSRLLEWKASPGRGETHQFEDKVYYVDCYNANPSSMLDTLQFFRSRWSGVPKLYVLGTMNELGDVFQSAHREVGALLQLAEYDRAVFVGEGAQAFRLGALESGEKEAHLYSFKEANEARGVVDDFKGAVLLKGSRSYALENLLPETSEGIESEAVAC